MDLFSYPYAIGETKGNDASAQAQLSASKSEANKKMRKHVLDFFKSHGMGSCEDVADYWGGIYLWRYQDKSDFLQDCRRRVSELVKLQLIEDSGIRSKSKRNNNTITLWRLK